MTFMAIHAAPGMPNHWYLRYDASPSAPYGASDSTVFGPAYTLYRWVTSRLGPSAIGFDRISTETSAFWRASGLGSPTTVATVSPSQRSASTRGVGTGSTKT